MTDTPKFCKDCRHCEQTKDLYPRCAKFPHLVTGKADGFCDIERKYAGPCGPAAALFEAKDKWPFPEAKPRWKLWLARCLGL